MFLKELDATAWTEQLLNTPRPGMDNVLAFYEHRMGAVCRDPRLMLVPLDDHMVHRGDGIFESLRMSEGKLLQLEAHLRRMQDSAGAIGLVPPCAWAEIGSIIRGVAQAAFCSPDLPELCDEGGVKVLMGRGGGSLGVAPSECPQASLFVVATRAHRLPESYWEKGLTACRSSIPAKQAYLAQIKSTNYLPNALMTQEAAERGVNQSFCFDDKGFLAEAAIANVAVVNNDGYLLMPHFEHALPGTTALLAKDVAEKFMPVILTDITEKILFEASEILILGTTPVCVAVTHYEGRPVGSGRPGPVACKLRHDLLHALLAGGVPLSEF